MVVRVRKYKRSASGNIIDKSVKMFDWKDTSGAAAWWGFWKGKGFKVFDFGVDTDMYVLIAAKSKPSAAEIRRYSSAPLKGKEIKKWEDSYSSPIQIGGM